MQSQGMGERMGMVLDTIEEGAAVDAQASAKDAITDAEIDRMFEVEEQVEDAREAQQMSALRAELEELKGEGAKEDVFVGAYTGVVNAHRIVGGDRYVEETQAFRAAVFLAEFHEDTLFVPELERLVFARDEFGIADFFEHS